MISPDEFDRIRARVCASGPASDGDNLLGMEIDAFVYLNPANGDDAGLWHDMNVQRSEGAEWLITGHASGTSEDAASIAEVLPRIWEQRLRYNHLSAYTVVTAPESITLLAVTQMDAGGIWVTANIQVGLS